MDETVLRAMQKWPNVPSVYGWLALDRRGTWRIKGKTGQFEPIVNPAMRDFIGRNYASDENGCWYLQNGPQRVFVALDYTPWIYQLDSTGTKVATHTNATVQQLRALFVDDAGALLIESELGIGVLLDRDLVAMQEHLQGADEQDATSMFEAVSTGNAVRCRFFGQDLPIEQVQATEIPTRFRFNPRPTPAPGQPDC